MGPDWVKRSEATVTRHSRWFLSLPVFTRASNSMYTSCAWKDPTTLLACPVDGTPTWGLLMEKQANTHAWVFVCWQICTPHSLFDSIHARCGRRLFAERRVEWRQSYQLELQVGKGPQQCIICGQLYWAVLPRFAMTQNLAGQPLISPSLDRSPLISLNTVTRSLNGHSEMW